MIHSMRKKIGSIVLYIIMMSTLLVPVLAEQPTQTIKDTQKTVHGLLTDYPLPPPLPVDMILEQSICRRMSVRTFTDESVTDEELSTILWAAYGFTESGGRTIYNPNGTYSTIIYVIRSEATYKYIPRNHSLSLFKSGNYLDLGEYDAPIKFGLVWDTHVAADERGGIGEIGMIGQNIYFDANALDLGTVTTGMSVNDLYQLGIPAYEKPEIIMPLGHPASPYDFTYSPLPVSNLPQIVNTTDSLADAINNRFITSLWDNTPLSLLYQSQLIWSSYGSSYNIDNVNHVRHRTLPSAIDIYPYKIFAANQTGVYQYNPSTHALSTLVQGDKRQAISNSLVPTNITITSASWILIPCLDTNLGSSVYQRFWYYEVGAISHNVMLESAALNLSGNIITGIADANGLRTALGIASQTNLVPLAVLPTGHPLSDNPPAIPDLSGPTNGKTKTNYNYTVSSTDPDNDEVSYWIDWGDGTNTGWKGPYGSGIHVIVSHSWSKRGTYIIKAKAKDALGAESDWRTLEVSMPTPDLSGIFLFKFFEKFPFAFPLLHAIFNQQMQ